ncbi:MAG: hypothetical protein WB580_05700 [Candidatus Binataceae bacterium]
MHVKDFEIFNDGMELSPGAFQLLAHRCQFSRTGGTAAALATRRPSRAFSAFVSSSKVRRDGSGSNALDGAAGAEANYELRGPIQVVLTWAMVLEKQLDALEGSRRPSGAFGNQARGLAVDVCYRPDAR